MAVIRLSKYRSLRQDCIHLAYLTLSAYIMICTALFWISILIPIDSLEIQIQELMMIFFSLFSVMATGQLIYGINKEKRLHFIPYLLSAPITTLVQLGIACYMLPYMLFDPMLLTLFMFDVGFSAANVYCMRHIAALYRMRSQLVAKDCNGNNRHIPDIHVHAVVLELHRIIKEREPEEKLRRSASAPELGFPFRVVLTNWH